MVTILAVAAHPDDAVLSYGASLSEHIRNGDRVVVYTVFCGIPDPPYTPTADALHRLWDLMGDPMAPRLDEDRSALEVLGAEPVHGDFYDAIYRNDENGPLIAPPSGPPRGISSPAEPGLVAAISDEIGNLIAKFEPAILATGAAIGDHVDHVRVRDGVLSAGANAGIEVLLWEDLPYATFSESFPALPSFTTLAGPAARPVEAADWEIKMRATERHRSQHRMLRNGDLSIFDQLENHARRHGAAISSDRAELTWTASVNR
jgi:LmbE family N-acetylglucosaminyl deacetylase